MKKLLLGWLAIGCFACFGSAAQAEDSSVSSSSGSACDAGDIVWEYGSDAQKQAIQDAFDKRVAELEKAGMTPEAAAAQAYAEVNNTLDAVNNESTTVIGASIATTGAIVTAIDPTANVVSLGGMSASSAKLNSIEGMAAVAASGYNCGWELWLNPFAIWAKDDGKVLNNALTVTGGRITRGAYEADVYGANLGLTKRFDSWFVGAMFGYANADVDYKKGAYGGYDSDNFTVALYGGFEKNNFFANLAAGYTWTDYDKLNQDVTVADVRLTTRGKGSDHDGYSWFTNVEVGYKFNLANCWAITPSIGWRYTHLDVDGYRLTANDRSAVLFDRVRDSKYWSSRMPIMVEVARDFSAANIFVRGGYIREFNDKAPAVAMSLAGTNATYMGYGNNPSQNYGTAGAGVRGSIGRWNCGLTYDYLWNTDEFDSHTVNAYLGITF